MARALSKKWWTNLKDIVSEWELHGRSLAASSMARKENATTMVMNLRGGNRNGKDLARVLGGRERRKI